MATRAAELKARYWRELTDTRPGSIEEKDWNIFVAYVLDGRGLRNIARDMGIRLSEVDSILAVVEEALRFRPVDTREEVTPDSPVEALGLSVRARNKLHQLGCHTVAAVLDEESNRVMRRLGPATRDEVASALTSHGFTPPNGAAGPSTAGELGRALTELRQRLEIDRRRWQSRLSRLEERIRRLSR